MKLEQTIQRVRDVCRVRQLSLATEKSYVGWIERYARDVPRMPVAWSSERKMEAWLTKLAHLGVSRSTQHQAFCALLFLYRDALKVALGDVNGLRPKRAAHVRHAPSREDVSAMMREMRDVGGYPTKLVALMLYGCGLRVCEPLNLRIKDIRLTESRMEIHDSKGAKDRVVMIPCALMGAIKAQIEAARVQWARMTAAGLGVNLPGLLARKYPKAPMAWQWFWLFPSHKSCVCPRSGEVVVWRMHECNVQRAVSAAALRAGLQGAITPHHLRHSYATHAMQQGAFVRDVQAVLGHASMETTMGYLHAEAERVRSPLDVLPQANAVPFAALDAADIIPHRVPMLA
jgi:integron integrase